MKNSLAGLVAVLSSLGCSSGDASEIALITHQLSDKASWVGGEPLAEYAQLDLPQKPVGVSICGNSGLAVVTSTEVSRISLIDIHSQKLLRSLQYGEGPFGVDCDAEQLIIGDWYANTVSRFKLSDLSLINQMDVGAAPAQVVLHRDQQTAYVANRDDDQVMQLDLVSGTVIRQLKVGDAPFGLAISPDQKILVAVNVGDDTVSLINAQTLQLIKTVGVGARPYCAVFSIDGNYLYVSNQDDDTVSIVSVASGQLVNSVEVGSTPEGIDISADGKTLWVVNWGDASLSLINTDRLTVSTLALDAEGSRAVGRFLFH